MEFNFRNDMEKLFGDTQKVKEGLDALRKDQATWAVSREHEDLVRIFEGLKSLEFDVSVLMSDCSSLDQVRRNDVIMGDLNQAFKGLDIIYRDLKTVRREIDESFGNVQKLWHGPQAAEY